MRMRHRIPMTFTLSMLDLFCCALGCVTLLWLVNQREAMLRARDATGLQSTLDTAKADLSTLRGEYASATGERDKLDRMAAQLQTDLDRARARAERLTKDLAAANRKAESALEKATQFGADLAVLTREAERGKTKVDDLTAELGTAKGKLAVADRRANELAARLRESEALAGKLKSTAEQVPDLKASAGEKGEQLTAARSRIHVLEDQLDAAKRSLGGADTDKKDLLGQLARARSAAENRFEGIALTGKRVIFLVDMSGSMDMVDNQTPAANKWPAVRDALVKVFRSLPDLEKFQIILFSDQTHFLLGNEGKWLDRDPQSADRIIAAMSAVKPKGGTDMYQGLEAAFRYKPVGLDTIYLLSDGLPNIGVGLSEAAARTMSESQRAEVLSQHIRLTLKTSWNIPAARGRVKINAVGFFFESPEVGAFLWALARENDGSFVGMSKP